MELSSCCVVRVQEQLQTYEPLIRRFLQGDIIHPEWVPPHDYDSEAPWSNSKARVDRPRMLKFGEQDRPDMLLYGLGSLDQVDIQFAERLNLFMSHDEHTHVIFTNLLTVLISCPQGYIEYIWHRKDTNVSLRLSGLGYILTYMEGTQLCGHPSTWQQPLANNIQRARQALNNVITARLLIFELFYDLVQLLRIEEQVARQKWLLLQLRSDIIFGTSDDLFDELRAGVSRIDPNLTRATSRPRCTSRATRCPDGSTLAPVLREVVRHFSSSFPTQRLIVSGTRIDMNVVTDAIEMIFKPISNSLGQLDTFIQMAVVSLTGFDTNNVEWELEHLYGLIREDYELSGSFAARHLREALFAYTLRNQQTSLWSDVEDHVSLGLALLDDDATHASIWEPLVFYRLYTWVINSPDCGIDTLTLGPWPRIVSVSTSRTFDLRSDGLSDYLDFRGAIPGWADATAEIVLPPCTRTSRIRVRYPAAFSITAAKRPDDVLDWLNGGDHPFLIPDDGLGADLMFFLRLKHVNLGSTAVVLVTLQLARPSRSTRRDATIVPIQPAMFYPKRRHLSHQIFTQTARGF
ncbi:hypothetical protein BKA62DRAFT_775287 [Auriculariales sp. MPI-PUGE-AT-0066]|nr:hypothetical protein BKA62DRAFT_775287 [Auriculariales sp. MPI-PUGE-AT-0066]